jgi:lipopolysaccharide export system permease protein
MKILTRYILKEHIAPFLFAFFTITFLLVIDFIPRITDSVMDKDISVWIALELLGLNLAWILALSIPMSALVATLMAFGRLTADFEITAIKSSGVNMLRVIMPVLIAGLVLTFLMIEFNDKILPDLNKKARELRGDISAMRPTLVFRSGIFISDVPGYLVLIDDIDHITSEIKGVSITDTKNNNRPRIIIAEHGLIEMTDGNKNMKFTLYNGEIHSLDLLDPENYRQVEFENQIINITGTGSELQRNESSFRGDREQSINDMWQVVDKAEGQIFPRRQQILTTMQDNIERIFSDTIGIRADKMTDSAVYMMIKKSADNLRLTVKRNRQQIASHKKRIAQFSIEIHKKYSIPAAIISFILIGAPLGIMSKRKGMGVAITISIILFVIYWSFLIGGEDLADRELISPFWGMWTANFLLSGIGLYLLYLVVSEKPIFSWFRKKRK